MKKIQIQTALAGEEERGFRGVNDAWWRFPWPEVGGAMRLALWW
ncbi:hypothetical protein [Shewanella cyperi]|nr:hypothetical protein [Shewanella cyperi]